MCNPIHIFQGDGIPNIPMHIKLCHVPSRDTDSNCTNKLMSSTNKSLGYLCAIIAATTYGFNPLFGLPLYARGMSTPSVLFYRFFFASLMLTGVKLYKKSSFRLEARQILPLVAGGVLLALSATFLFLSFRVMDAGIAATILFVYPVMVALIMAIGFHERISFFTWGSMIVALAGIALLNASGGKVSLLGLVYVLLSALTYAIYMVLVKESSLKRLPSDTLTLYAMLAGLPVFLVPLKGGMLLQMPSDGLAWVCVFGLALFPALLSFLLMAVAIKRIGATTTAIIGALEPCTALVIGVCVFNEHLTLRSLVGIAMILVAVSLVVLSRKK